MPKTKRSREELMRKRAAQRGGLAATRSRSTGSDDWGWESRIDYSLTYPSRHRAQEAAQAEYPGTEPFPCGDHWHLWVAPPRMEQNRVDDIIVQQMIEADGQHVCPSDIGGHFNRTYCPEGWHPLSAGDVLDSMDRLAQEGRLAILKPAERWRENHGWVSTPPVYGLPS